MHRISAEVALCHSVAGMVRTCAGRIALVLVVSLLLSGCRASGNAAGHLDGRWQKTGASGLGEPDLLISEYLEFREDGQVVVLLHNGTPDRYWTIGLGRFTRKAPGQIELAGRCWKGYESFDCTRVYRLEVSGDHLVISAKNGSGQQVKYRRIGAVSDELPPTLAPPAPTPAPADG